MRFANQFSIHCNACLFKILEIEKEGKGGKSLINFFNGREDNVLFVNILFLVFILFDIDLALS